MMTSYIAYIPSLQEEAELQDYFHQQATQTGLGFRGSTYQRGLGLGSVFRGLLKTVWPITKTAIKETGKKAAKAAFSAAAEEGFNQANNIAKEVKQKMVGCGRKRPMSASRKGAKRRKTTQKGRGLGRRPTLTQGLITTIKRSLSRHKSKSRRKAREIF